MRTRTFVAALVLGLVAWLGGPAAALAYNCDYSWQGTTYQNNCPTSWSGAGDGCDCGCQFHDSDCGDEGEDIDCGYATGTWNAPRGALVLNRSSSAGPVKAVIDGIGEYWTHSAVSHGADASATTWASMSTMTLPRSYPDGDSSCNHPVEPHDLADGWPGGRTNTSGGQWTYYYSDGNYGHGQESVQYILPGTGYRYNYGSSGYASSYGTDADVVGCFTDWEKNSMAGCSGKCQIPFGYSVYAYSWNQLGSSGTTQAGYGTMCSGLQARSYYWATKPGSTSYCTPNAVSNYTYANAKVWTASTALYNNVNSGSMSFWESLGSFFACWFDTNLLDEAGDQVVNCFAYNQGTSCTKADHDWYNNHVNYQTATSVSPDRLVGRGTHLNDANNNSPWKGYGANTVYFNQGGRVHGCWF
jgi:hypothetical protein